MPAKKPTDQVLLSLDEYKAPHTEALGWQWAYGCFETFFWNRGSTVALGRHLERFLAGCRSLDMECRFRREDLEETLRTALEPFREKTLRVRLEGVLDDPGLMGGGSPPFGMRVGLRLVECPAYQRKEPFAACLLDPDRSSRLPTMPSYKPLDYFQRIRIRNEMIREGFDEGIVMTRDLRVVSALTSNLFVRSTDGTWKTPPVASGCLPGVTRSLLLDFETPEPSIEGTVSLHNLTEATGIFLTNSSIGIQPVHRLEVDEGSAIEIGIDSSEKMADWYEEWFLGN